METIPSPCHTATHLLYTINIIGRYGTGQLPLSLIAIGVTLSVCLSCHRCFHSQLPDHR
ncbi:hypothetical protein OG21DRAFT_339235 [Imleria badia]|nr:hypothetical protein OG21DRAFT_339235 [Imleria badia]